MLLLAHQLEEIIFKGKPSLSGAAELWTANQALPKFLSWPGLDFAIKWACPADLITMVLKYLKTKRTRVQTPNILLTNTRQTE